MMPSQKLGIEIPKKPNTEPRLSAQEFGFAIPDLTRDEIVYGDLIGMGLALATLYALRYRWRVAIALAWVFVVATVLDLSNAAVMGIREDLFDKAADVSWLILTFYVPALWVSVVLVAWRLWMGRGERVASS